MAESSHHTPQDLTSASKAPGGVDEPRRGRLRFKSFHFERTQSARCSAAVELEWVAGESVIGRADGVASQLGDLRAAAEATLRAIETFLHGSVALELIGVKTMRAFDANIVMVSIHAMTSEGPRRLLGCNLSEEDLLRGAVIASLQATNRVLGNAIATR
jgi:hypothetical protein